IPPKAGNAEGAEKSAEGAEGGVGVLVPECEGSADVEEAPKLKAGQAEQLASTIVLEDRVIYPRTIDELPPETQEIKPHPYGVEFGSFLQMLKRTDETQVAGFLKNSF